VYLRVLLIIDTAGYISLNSITEIAGQHVLTHIATRVKVDLLLDCVASATWETHAL
jgi:hypothetical protein